MILKQVVSISFAYKVFSKPMNTEEDKLLIKTEDLVEPIKGIREKAYTESLTALQSDYSSLMKFIATLSASCLVFTASILKASMVNEWIRAAWTAWGIAIVCILLALSYSVYSQDHYLKQYANDKIAWNKIKSMPNWPQGWLVAAALVCFISAFVLFTIPFYEQEKQPYATEIDREGGYEQKTD